MLTGLLGGLSNLGQIYRGYQNQQAIDAQNLLQQQQAAATNAIQKLALSGAFNPLQTQPPQPLATPTPTTATTTPPAAPSTPTPTTANIIPPSTTAFDTPTTPATPSLGGPVNGFGTGLPQPPGTLTPPPLQGLGQYGNLASALPVAALQPPSALTPAERAPGQSLGLGNYTPLPNFQIASTLGDNAGLGPPPQAQFPTANMFTSTFDQPLARGGATPQPSLGFRPYQPMTQPAAPQPTPGGGQVLGGPDDGTAPDTDIVGTGAGGRNNPGNIKTASGGWARFDTPQQGVAAIGDWLVRAQNTHGLTTIRQLIDDSTHGYAPSADPGNAGKNLPEAAARIVGVNPDTPVNMNDPGTREKMVRAILTQEGAQRGGRGDLTNAAFTEMSSNLSPEQHAIGDRGIAMVLARMPQIPRAVQMMNPQQLAQTIEQQFPGTSDAVKGAIFLKAWPMMNEAAKEQTAAAWYQYDAQVKQLEDVMKWRHEAAQDVSGKAADWKLVDIPGQGIARINERTGQVEPTTFPAGTRILGSGSPDPGAQVFTLPDGSSTWISPGQPIPPGAKRAGTGETTADKPGKLVELSWEDEQGQPHDVQAMELAPGKYVNPVTGQALTGIPSTAKVAEEPKPGQAGGRTASQFGRQLVAGGEVAQDLENLKSLPVGATTGPWPYGGPGTTLLGAATGDLTRSLTKQDERFMQMNFAGLSRELSILMSPVYSGKWGADSLDPLIPKYGDSVYSSLYGMARIKQSALVAMNGLLATPDNVVSKSQKEYVRQGMNTINQSIPWSVADVIAFQKQGRPKETFGEFVDRVGLAGKGKDQPTTGGARQPSSPTGTQPPAEPSARADIPGKKPARDVTKFSEVEISQMGSDDLAELVTPEVWDKLSITQKEALMKRAKELRNQ